MKSGSVVLVPINRLAHRNGAKILAYGPPGVGKTPLAATTVPRPVVCVLEPGTSTLRDRSDIPAFDCVNAPKRVDDFVRWLQQSAEARQFDTVIMDSASEYAEAILRERKAANTNKQKAYGEMAEKVLNTLAQLYYLPQKHVIMLAKESEREFDGALAKRPFFPGQELNVHAPHAFDAIIRQAREFIPNVTGPQLCLRTAGTPNIIARIRLPGNQQMPDIIPPNYGDIITAMTRY